MEEMISDLQQCAQICRQTVMRCLETGGQHSEPGHIGLMLDCAALCETTGKLHATNSGFIGEMTRLCADACEACASDCGRFEEQFMKACAEACRHCAETCRTMANKEYASAKTKGKISA